MCGMRLLMRRREGDGREREADFEIWGVFIV
jgi:hypothetical protein